MSENDYETPTKYFNIKEKDLERMNVRNTGCERPIKLQ